MLSYVGEFLPVLLQCSLHSRRPKGREGELGREGEREGERGARRGGTVLPLPLLFPLPFPPLFTPATQANFNETTTAFPPSHHPLRLTIFAFKSRLGTSQGYGLEIGGT